MKCIIYFVRKFVFVVEDVTPIPRCPRVNTSVKSA